MRRRASTILNWVDRGAFCVLTMLVFACSPPDEGSDERSQEEGASANSGQATPDEDHVADTAGSGAEDTSGIAVPTPQTWVDERVQAATERLEANEAGRLIAQAIEAHGGLERWYRQRALTFRFQYQALEGHEGPSRDTVQTVDVWSSRARHQLANDRSAEFGWSGEQAWATDESLLEMNPRFWSLTPYYFVGVPFVLADEGIQLTYEGDWEFEGRTWKLVRATFGDGVGDAPDDFYVVLIDSETHRVGGVRYIVTYPGFFPEGGHSPEKLLTYDGSQEAGGIKFAESYRSFPWTEEGPGEQTREAILSELEWRSTVPAGYFAVPDGAVIQQEM